MKTLKLEIAKKTAHFQRVVINVNNKLVATQFYCLSPTSKKDLEILCSQINALKAKGLILDTLGAVAYRIFDYDDVTEGQNSLIAQLDLKNNRVSTAFDDLCKHKLKFIKPSTRLYRDRFSSYIDKYKKLEKIPKYLHDHFVKLLNLPKENPDLDATHISFWRDLSQEMNVDERGKLAHFIEWHYNLQHDRGADIFLPPVPYVTLKGVEFLIGKAIEINILAQDMIDGDVATYFSIDAEVFKNREAVERILNYIYKNPNKCRFVIFEIHNPEKILQPGFGLSSLEHLALFLRTIKSMKETTTRIFGLLNGGGFGYCLLGAGFDFFTDTISNYVEFPQKRAGHRPRKFLNPITITPESFEDIENYWLDHGSLPDDCETCEDEYNNVLKVFNRKTIDLDKWSVDCRKHGINVWNRLTREVINSINHNNDGLFYEIVQRTFTYTKLTPIIRDIDLL